MNDRYLFRGKRIDNGEWVTGYYVCDPFSYNSDTILDHSPMRMHGSLISHAVIPKTVSQCIGIKDKNVKPIYEGDLINDVDDEVLYIVAWRGYRYVFVKTTTETWCEISMFDLEYIEVVGNIHENPGLLED